MENSNEERREKKSRLRKHYGNKIKIFLAAIVAIVTVHALILPAVTMELELDNEEYVQQSEPEEVEEVMLPEAMENDAAYITEVALTEANSGNAAGTCTDTAAYDLRVRFDTYGDNNYSQARIRLEIVLPLTAEQGSFDLETMNWLDQRTGYESQIVTEIREIDGVPTECQVLTGYKMLQSDSPETVIPKEFTERVAVKISDGENAASFALRVSAALEQNVWDGICPEHQIEEKQTVVSSLMTVVKETVAEETVEEAEPEEPELEANTEEEAEVPTEPVAEVRHGENWKALRDSGWFEAYSNYAVTSRTLDLSDWSPLEDPSAVQTIAEDKADDSSQQVDRVGGANQNETDQVSVSKIIHGTELENVFDITLQIQTPHRIEEVVSEPDMAVVIVMDISATMTDDFNGVTRYAAAMEAAEAFLDDFAANNTLGVSKVGYVAFNTDAHQIFGLQPCTNETEANALKNIMRTNTGSIINQPGYGDAHNRFTNMEAGLTMARDMLNGASNKNKSIIFLSDGFPTTYISSGYNGIDPYGKNLYDGVLGKWCLYGTSYSDTAAIRAREVAMSIKASGTTIYSIGVDVGGQKLQKYISNSEDANGFSVVERKSETYEIGAVTDEEGFKNWLRNSIGSGQYYDSTDAAGLKYAYEEIFKHMKEIAETGSQANWVAEDPIPSINGAVGAVEFIGLYDKEQNLAGASLSGEHGEDKENTAVYTNDKYTIKWDLKKSGYTAATTGDVTTYIYELKYRVRLQTEGNGFIENKVYDTNDTTTLNYIVVENKNGVLSVSDDKTIEFPIPAVHGYIAELTFNKMDNRGNALGGAEFTLSHDAKCSICRGDGTTVEIPDQVAVSAEDGRVVFQNIPSGHQYTLTETRIPVGYIASGNIYRVKVAYDETTVMVYDYDGSTELEWNGTIENKTYYELPKTGGTGTEWYRAAGILMVAAAVFGLCNRKRKMY